MLVLPYFKAQNSQVRVPNVSTGNSGLDVTPLLLNIRTMPPMVCEFQTNGMLEQLNGLSLANSYGAVVPLESK
jgi:hypothetical protein